MSTEAGAPAREGDDHQAMSAAILDTMARGAASATVLRQIQESLRQKPLAAYLQLARALSQAGYDSLVPGILDEARGKWPDDVNLQYSLGNALRMVGDTARAETLLRAVVQQNPLHEKAAHSLAYMLRDAGRTQAAARVMLDLAGQRQWPPEHQLAYAEFLHECRRYREAADYCRAQLERDGANLRLQLTAGRMVHALGEFEPARRHFLAALDGGLDMEEWGGVLVFLANCQKYEAPDHPDLRRFAAVQADKRLGSDARAAAAFALAKALNDLGLIEQAAANLRAANALAAVRHHWSNDGWQRWVNEQVREKPLPQARQPLPDEPVPVFIVGLPRTGTSLLADRLGRHSQLRNRGELNWMQFIAGQIEQSRALRNVEALRYAAGLYLRQLRQDDAPARWYVDKNPLNFRYLGLIAGLLPQARIIHCRRNRRDTALSLWSQFFGHEDDNFSYTFGNIAAFMDGAERLMQHWRSTLPLPIHTVEYERMIEAPEATLAEAAQFLGLPPEDLLGGAPKPDAPIATASVWQARQPVYRSSQERWRAYAPFEPALEGLFAEGSV